MAPITQEELQHRAERAVRRGELLVALDLFETLLAQQPENEPLRTRIESVRALLQPSELVARRRAEPSAEEKANARPLTAAEEGELAAAAGRFTEAVELYEKVVRENPKNELLRERLVELMQYAPPPSRAVDDGLAAAERLERGSLPGSHSSPGRARSARALDAGFRGLDSRPPPRVWAEQAPAVPAAEQRPFPAAAAAQAAPAMATQTQAPPAPQRVPRVDLLRDLLQRVQHSPRRL
jgi:tetratricopeptide (TPR) repeat protein